MNISESFQSASETQFSMIMHMLDECFSSRTSFTPLLLPGSTVCDISKAVYVWWQFLGWKLPSIFHIINDVLSTQVYPYVCIHSSLD